MGLSGMLISLLLLAAMVGLVPDRNAAIRDGHARLAEAIAVNSSIFITTSDIKRMSANLQVVVERNKNILSAAVRRPDGQVLSVIGDHKQNWQTSEQGMSSESQVIVPIFEGDKEWGQVELAFEPLLPSAWYGSLLNPVFLLLGFMSLTSFILFYLYLGKMLKQLDPSQAIPDRVRSALDTMAEGLLVIDAKQNIVLANLAFSNLANESSEKLMGRSIDRLPWLNSDDESLDAEDYPWSLTLVDGVLRTADMIRLKTEDGSSKTFMTNCSPVMSGSGKPAGVLISFDDVTELEQKELELRISKEEAEQANRFKSEFLANMSHEIRTPMNAILGFAEVLKRGYDRNSSESIKYLNTISTSGNHLLSLINDILDLSKVEAGQIEIEKIHTPVHHIINEVVQILQVKANEKNIYLRYEPFGSLPEYMDTDAGKVRQIVTNLVGNAIKFTDIGGVSIVTSIHEEGDGSMLTIDVVDTGIGMTKPQAEEIFSPFTQADSSITRRFGGTGLGLTISKRFAEALGGGISVQSEPGVGSHFIATINIGSIGNVKLLNADECLATELQEQAVQKKRWKFHDTKVLVVDDGEENRELIKVVLSEVGIQIETADNGQRALDAADGQVFDVILMDVQMPVMDGYQAAKLMRERNLGMPIVAMTADAMSGAEQKCLDAGFSDYMAKPVDIDLLIEWLADALGAELQPEIEMKASQAETASAKGYKEESTEKIYSSLPVTNAKYRIIIEKFVERLGDQMEVINSAWQQRDYDELRRLGHWLKGSSGSIGFSQFVEPAKEFEQSAIEEDDASIECLLIELQSIYSRVAVEPEPEPEPQRTEDAVVPSKNYQIPEKFLCRLQDTNPRIRPVIERFIEQLSDWLDVVDEAVDNEDFEKIGQFAYWLKAAGGSVGFDAFTEPARDLEEYIKEKHQNFIQHPISVIRELDRRISLTKIE